MSATDVQLRFAAELAAGAFGAYGPSGVALAHLRYPGERFASPAMAASLERIARTDGDAFYRGELADAMVRHRVKSQVVLAGALCCAGKRERARTVADAAFDEAGRAGLVPLRWALACLLIDAGSATRTDCRRRVRAIATAASPNAIAVTAVLSHIQS